MHDMVIQICLNIGSVNGLLSDGINHYLNNCNKRLDLLSKMFCGIHLKAISQEMLMNLICSGCLEITLLKSLAYDPVYALRITVLLDLH